MKNICSFAGISSEFYDHYDFKVFNQSKTLKNARLNFLYSAIRRYIRRHTHNLPIYVILRRMKTWFDPIYYHFNTKDDETIEITPDLGRKLEDYYRTDVDRLQNILGCEIPWPISSQQKRVAS